MEVVNDLCVRRLLEFRRSSGRVFSIAGSVDAIQAGAALLADRLAIVACWLVFASDRWRRRSRRWNLGRKAAAQGTSGNWLVGVP